MKRFLVAVLICFLLGWNIGIMISNNMLKIENQNLREEIKIYKDKNGVMWNANQKNIWSVIEKNIWSVKCGGQNKCSGLKNIFPKTTPPNTCSVYLAKKSTNTCSMKKRGRTFVLMLLVEHCLHNKLSLVT